MVGDIKGYCQLKADAIGASINDMSEFRHKICRAMEINEDTKSVLVINPKATALGMFDMDQVVRYFRCDILSGVITPPDLNPMERFEYVARVMAYSVNQKRDMSLMRQFVIATSLAKGSFDDRPYFQSAAKI